MHSFMMYIINIDPTGKTSQRKKNQICYHKKLWCENNVIMVILLAKKR